MRNLARKIVAIFMVMAILIPAMSFSFAANAVERIDLNISAITIGVGQKVKTVEPVAYPKGSATTFTWESSDEKIATVNAKGQIKGVKKGSATITISAGGVSTELEVNVVQKGKGVTKISLPKTASVVRGKSTTLKATFTPAKPKNKTIIWKSSDESVATVDSKGKVTGVATGKVTITAISSSGKSAKCTVTVNPVQVKKIKITGKASMLRNETQQLSVTFKPADADNKNLKWTSSNKKVATVDANGVVTAKKKGTVTITAAAKDGSKVKGTFKITVNKVVSSPTPAPKYFTDKNGIEYYLAKGTAVVCGYTGNATKLTIPGSVKGHTVTSIDDSAFYDCSNLTSIVIPDSVSSIGDSAFQSCSSLTSIVIPDGATSIGKCAFQSCSSLTSIVIPDGVSSIGDYTFWYCSSLTSISIPNSVTSIGVNVFEACSSLTSIVIPDSVTSIGKYAFSFCSNLTSICIPDSVTSISNGIFYKCSNLTSVVIPDSVTSIGDDAFYYCSALKTVYAESLSGWLGISFENRTSNPMSYANKLYIGGAPLTNAVIPHGMTKINNYAFEKCEDLVSVTIPDSVTSIGKSAFSSCISLTSIAIPDGVTSIDEYTFSSCRRLTSFVIPDGVTSIGKYAFSGCYDLASIVLPDGITSIGENAFSYSRSLTSVVIPASVASIGSDAFSYCPNLTATVTEGSYAHTYCQNNSIPFMLAE